MSTETSPRSYVLDAAFRRLARTYGAEKAVPAARAPSREPAPRPGARRPVVTLDPPAVAAARRGDPAALATLLADDLAAKLDELVYVWNVLRELEPFAEADAIPLRRRAAELALVRAGGALDLPIEDLLRAAKSFMDRHGMDERYVRTLCAWYGV
jgi:hypothetical protein